MANPAVSSETDAVFRIANPNSSVVFISLLSYLILEGTEINDKHPLSNHTGRLATSKVKLYNIQSAVFLYVVLYISCNNGWFNLLAKL